MTETRSPPAVPPDAIAVIGAGIAGLTAARTLGAAGRTVVVFDKGRGVGGRLSTRRTEHGPFDHGAQYVTARDPEFRAAVDGWTAAGVVARWSGRVVRLADGGRAEPDDAERHVGVPGMSALPRHLAVGLADVRTDVRIDRIEGAPGAWRLVAEDGGEAGPFAAVLVTVPSPQARPLLAPVAPSLAASAAAAPMAPCWAVMIAFESPVETGFDAAFVTGGPLSWIARDGSKPGRPAGERWVLHGSPDWSTSVIEASADDVIRDLSAAFAGVAGRLPGVARAAAHRWRFALPTAGVAEGYAFDAERAIGIAGDWCAGARVEGAWVSGLRLARALEAAGR